MERKERSEKRWMGHRGFLKITGFLGVLLLLGLWGSHISSASAAEVYPADKIRWIIPYSPGGGFDLIARGLTPYLTKYLREGSPGSRGGELMIKNEPGASGQKAYSITYGSKPDGYTICSVEIAIAIEALFSKVEFDLDRFTYLVRPMVTTRLLVTGKNGFASWDEMVKAAKAKELKWGVGAFGRSTHADSIVVKETVGIPARFIAFGGTSENMNALMRGDIQMSLVSSDSVEGLVKAKEVRPLVQFADKSEYPGVPSIKDLGYPQLAEKLGGYRFIVGPPGLPKNIQDTLISAFKKSFSDKEFQTWTKKSNFDLDPLYGNDADQLAKKMINYYQQDLKPMLKKYLDK
jgi:tripartite-type tricarboxylate transporter receptor subunit TctC